MSAALDQLSAEDTALLNQMQADEAAAPDMPQPDAGTPDPASELVSDAAPAPTQQPDKQPTMVDKRALDEERARRRELEAKFQAQQVENAKVSERLDLLMKAAQQHVTPPPAPPVPAPEFEKDPGAFIKHSFEQLGNRLNEQERAFQEKLAKLEQGTTQLTQAQQQQQAVAQLDNWAATQEAAYRNETPDYDAAMAHLRDSRTNMMRLMGVPEEHIAAQIMNDVRGVAHMARERGMNFAETLYKMAGAQGYRKADAAPAAAAAAGAAPAPAANAAERLMRGQDMATTIGSTGAAPRGAPAASVLANMSDAEFAKLYADVSKDPTRMRAMFGE